MSTAQTPAGVDAAQLSNFCQSLDEIEQAANGYGSLQAAVITCEIDDTVVTATYQNYGGWNLTFATKPAAKTTRARKS